MYIPVLCNCVSGFLGSVPLASGSGDGDGDGDGDVYRSLLFCRILWLRKVINTSYSIYYMLRYAMLYIKYLPCIKYLMNIPSCCDFSKIC